MARVGLLAGLAVAAAALLGLPVTGSAVPTLAGEYDVDGRPGRLTVGVDGSAWVSVPSVNHDTARVRPDGTVTHFDLPNILNAAGPAGLATAADGRIWATATGGIVSFDPADPVGSATFLPIAALATPDDLAFGPDGRLYTAAVDGADSRLFIVDTTTPPGTLVNAGGTVVAGLQNPRGIAVGGDGLVYIGDFGGEQVVSFNPATSDTVAYGTGGGVQAVGAGPGTQIGYAVPNQILGRIAPGGTAQPTDAPGSDSFGIVLGRDGAYWAPGFVTATAFRLTATGELSQPISFGGANPGPRRVATGPDDTVWFSLEFPDELTGKVARVTGVSPPPPAPGPGGPGGPGVQAPPPGITAVTAASRAVRQGRPFVISTRLSQRSTLLVRVHRMLPGRRAANGRCVAPRPALRRARTCVRYVQVGIFPALRNPGVARVAVGPRVGRTRLGVGRYRIGVRARNAARRVSPWRTVVVRVIP